jgi:hypothetical protein
MGLNGRPKSFVVSALDPSGNASVEAGDIAVSVALAADGPSVFAVAYR